jgi:hypothetical protein
MGKTALKTSSSAKSFNMDDTKWLEAATAPAKCTRCVRITSAPFIMIFSFLFRFVQCRTCLSYPRFASSR